MEMESGIALSSVPKRRRMERRIVFFKKKKFGGAAVAAILQVTQGCRNANETPNAILTAQPNPGGGDLTKLNPHFLGPTSPFYFFHLSA